MEQGSRTPDRRSQQRSERSTPEPAVAGSPEIDRLLRETGAMRDLMERQAAQNSRQLDCFQQMMGASERAFATARQGWEDERREMISEQDRQSALAAGAAQATEDWGQWEEDDVRHPRHSEALAGS